MIKSNFYKLTDARELVKSAQFGSRSMLGLGLQGFII